MNQFWLKFAAMVRAVIASLGARIGVSVALTGGIAVLFTDDIQELWGKVKGDVYKVVTDEVKRTTGLELNPLDPLADASVSAALSARSGINITTVMDAKIMTRDLAAHVSGLVEQQTTIKLTNLLSVEQVKADLVGHAYGVVEQQTGLELAGAVSVDDIRKKITKHIETRIVSLVVKSIERAAEEFSNPEATIDELLAMVHHGSEAQSLKVSNVGLGVAASIVVAAYAQMSAPIKRRVTAFRRRAQNREAQRRFRERHGNRMRYNPLKPKPEGGTGGAGGTGAAGV